MTNIRLFFRRDFLFTISGLLAVIACLIGRLSLDFIDFHVIFTLLGLMAVIKVLERLGVLDYFAEKLIRVSRTNRSLIRNLTFLAFFSSMILTNDIAILTLLPVFLKIVQKTPQFKEKVIGTTLIIIAANLGSSCLPFGNPQNLYLFAFYQMSFGDFLVLLLPFFGLSIAALLVACQFIPNKQLKVLEQERKAIETKMLILPVAAMLIMILSVLHLFPFQVAVVLAVLAAFFSDRTALKEVDYRLLGTFVFFFLIVGNLGEVAGFVTVIRAMLGSFTSVLFSSALISQVISNVPAALLLAPFTQEAQALVLGVNIGGLGTLIASLANLIGYKVFAVYFVNEKKELITNFSKINGIFLVSFLLFFYLLYLIK
ncbi:SLC13 family permease [Enterococcus sp. AZ109]|uniref:SLC13 family permease n=1 Tax=Enterococcus sp. AZ109 TaxID=2774634 RepID=UPI003F1F8542